MIIRRVRVGGVIVTAGLPGVAVMAWAQMAQTGFIVRQPFTASSVSGDLGLHRPQRPRDLVFNTVPNTHIQLVVDGALVVILYPLCLCVLLLPRGRRTP